ncbi:MAG: hypothetical protein U0105_24710 [Candidatus Obscuribacterales bacterium]
MEQRTLIIHGWSDVSASFTKLKEHLTRELKGTVQDIYFYDYESRENNVTYNDIAYGLNALLTKMGLLNPDGTSKYELNVIVHSTGGLVIRHWLTSFYGASLTGCPIKRIIMLAPANFGSPLAKTGKSFIGAIATGRKNLTDMADFFETGQQILDGLELGSSFQWHLAHKDLLSQTDFYSPRSIQTTVLVGIEDYKDFLRSFVNKPGTDGTVVISGTQLDTVKFSLNFAKAKYSWNSTQSISSTAFGVMPGLNHSSVVDAAADSKSPVSKAVLAALRTKQASDFEKLQQELKTTTEATYAKYTDKPRYEQFLVHAIDDFGVSISDFTLEFFVIRDSNLSTPASAETVASKDDTDLADDELEFSKEARSIICDEFETFTKDRSYRRFLVDVKKLRNLMKRAKTKFGGEKAVLCMKVWVPPVDKGIRYNLRALKALAILDSDEAKAPIKDYVEGVSTMPSLWYENTTTLIELQVNRENTYTWLSLTGMNKQQRIKQVQALVGK